MKKFLKGYCNFREKYIKNNVYSLQEQHFSGQKPKAMIISCCDSRVDPSLMLQCDPGDLFMIRNVGNIVPPYSNDSLHHGTSAAVEFGIISLNIEHLIILGHSQCGGIKAFLNDKERKQLEFMDSWISTIKLSDRNMDVDDCAKMSLIKSYENSLTFPWIKDRVANGKLKIDLCFFDIESAKIFIFDHKIQRYIDILQS